MMRQTSTCSRLAYPSRQDWPGWLCRIPAGLLVLLLLAGPLAQAQQITAQLHLSNKEPEPLWFEYVRADGGLATLSYMSKRSSRYLGIYKYDESFRRTWERQVLQNSNRLEIVHFTVLGERILLFVGEQNPGESTQTLYYYAYSLDGTAEAERVPLLTAPKKEALRSSLRFVHSINKQLLACVQQFPHDATDHPIRLAYHLFQQGQPGPRSYEFDLPYTGTDAYELKEAELSNSGNLHVLAKKEAGRRQPANDVRYVLARYRIADEQVLETPLYFSDSLITDLTFQLSPSEEVFMGGFYSRSQADQAYGLVFVRLDSADHAMTVSSFTPFSTSFLGRYLNERQLNRGNALTDFYLDKIILRSDGGMLFLAEQFYLTYVNYYDAYGFLSYQEEYHYDDVAAFSVSPAGEVEWHALVPKSQAGQSRMELSYFPAIGPAGVYVFFKAYQRKIGTHLYYQRILPDGTVEPAQVFMGQMRGADIFYRPACEQITNREAVLVYRRDGKFSLVKIRLEE
jgi:hypothetical protein